MKYIFVFLVTLLTGCSGSNQEELAVDLPVDRVVFVRVLDPTSKEFNFGAFRVLPDGINSPESIHIEWISLGTGKSTLDFLSPDTETGFREVSETAGIYFKDFELNIGYKDKMSLWLEKHPEELSSEFQAEFCISEGKTIKDVNGVDFNSCDWGAK